MIWVKDSTCSSFSRSFESVSLYTTRVLLNRSGNLTITGNSWMAMIARLRRDQPLKGTMATTDGLSDEMPPESLRSNQVPDWAPGRMAREPRMRSIRPAPEGQILRPYIAPAFFLQFHQPDDARRHHLGFGNQRDLLFLAHFLVRVAAGGKLDVIHLQAHGGDPAFHR